MPGIPGILRSILVLTATSATLSSYAWAESHAVRDDSRSATSIQIESIADIGEVSLRGVAQWGEDLVWVSGSQGTARRSADGGATWKQLAPSGTAESDFRWWPQLEAGELGGDH